MSIAIADYSYRQKITGTAPASSLSGFVAIITEANVDSTFFDNVDNGGGDVRVSLNEDGTSQLSLEIILCNTSTDKLIAWVRFPTYSTSARELYIFSGNTGQTQPAVTATYGRNNVWQDYTAVIHMSETGTDGVFTDVTGNGYDTTLTKGSSLATTSASNPFGLTWPDFTQNEALTLTGSAAILTNQSNYTLQAIVNLDSSNNNDGLIGNRSSVDDKNWVQIQSSGRVFTKGASTENFSEASPITPTSGNYWLALTMAGTNLYSYRDGVIVGTDSSISQNPITTDGQDFRIGTFFNADNTRSLNGRAAEARIRTSALSTDFQAHEYANQNAPATFWTQSTPDDPSGGGGGIALIPVIMNHLRNQGIA